MSFCFLNAFTTLSFSATFSSLIMMCFAVIFLSLLILVRIHLYSQICGNIVFIKFGKVWSFKNRFISPYFTYCETPSTGYTTLCFPTCHLGSVNFLKFFLLCFNL